MAIFRPPLAPRQLGDIAPMFGLLGPFARTGQLASSHASRSTKPADVRAMTPGEIDMARKLFAGAVNYNQVKVHRGSYFPFNLQDEHTAVTPNGEIYFLADDYLADFSKGTDFDKHWFIHEMVHVWQYQLGYPVMLRGALRIGLPYRYELDAKRKLCDYNMEAQGDLVADYFALKVLGNAAPVHNRKKDKASSTYTLAEYEQTLSDFIADPANKDNLP
jgi:hypothetical protein